MVMKINKNPRKNKPTRVRGTKRAKIVQVPDELRGLSWHDLVKELNRRVEEKKNVG